MKFPSVVVFLALPCWAPACDLCAVYNASNARGESSSGFLFTVSEQFIPYCTTQLKGEPFRSSPPAFEDFFKRAYHVSSITHLVPGYNFSPRVGVSLNVPLIYRSFRRTQLTPLGAFVDESGTEFGLGDMSLIGRWSILQKTEMNYGIIVNLLGGVKFPTGDDERVQDEVRQEQLFRDFFGGPGHYHSIGGVHLHDLTLGSGSYDGIFGATVNLRWQRWLFNSQIQYYLRTEAGSYEFGDVLMISGGPGAYVLLRDNFTLSPAGQCRLRHDGARQDP